MASVQNKREEKSKREEVKALHIFENGAMQWPNRMWTGPQTPEDIKSRGARERNLRKMREGN